MREASLKRFVSSLGSGTSVLDIPHPIVSMYTHMHTIENFKIFNFFAFDGHHWRTVGFWLRFLVPLGAHTCALGCIYLYLVGARTCSGPFRSIFKQQKCSRSDSSLQTSFLANSRKNEFWTFLPLLKASKLRFGGCRQSFLGASGGPNMHKNGQKGLPRCRKAQSNVQNTLEVLRNPFPNFRKIVEFGTFRQHRLGQNTFYGGILEPSRILVHVLGRYV